MGLSVVGMIASALAIQNGDCFDDKGQDRCDPIVRARTLEALGMVPIEDERLLGAEVYRALFVDGYGRDMPAVSLERRPNQGPRFVVYGSRGVTLVHDVADVVWETVRTDAEFADRALQPNRPSSIGEDIDVITFCLHSWVVTAEISEAGADRSRRRTEDACDEGLTVPFGFRLAALAVEAIPGCSDLDATRERNVVTQLETCLSLQGDRPAAANLSNAKSDLPWRLGSEQSVLQEWRNYLNSGRNYSSISGYSAPHLSWAGTPGGASIRATANGAAQFLINNIERYDGLEFYPIQVGATTRLSGWIDGEAAYFEREDDEDSVLYVARYRQTWTRQEGGEWELESFIVEPFAVREY